MPQGMRLGRSYPSSMMTISGTPVGFTSKGLSPTECNYTIYDKELLSVIRGLEEWRHILEGTKHTIEILNDHRNLTYFRTAQTLNCRQAPVGPSIGPDLTTLSPIEPADIQLSQMPYPDVSTTQTEGG